MSLTQLESFISDKMSETNLPGVSVRVVGDDEVPLSRGFGFRNIEDALPANERTSYAIGSITKSFTALSIMQLKEKGKLSVDDPVSDYLPLKIKPEGKPILIKNFLDHSSGIPALGYSESLIRKKIGAGKDWTPVADIEDMLDFVNGAEDWVYSGPGERWLYLNEGYALLGALIEKCSGLPYEEYVRKNIFSPLGMDGSFFDPFLSPASNPCELIH